MVVVVAGGTRGIGLELAAALEPSDGTVVLGYARDDRAAQEARARLEGLGRDVHAVRADLSRPTGARDLVAAAEGRRIDVLVHSSVSLGPSSMLAEGDDWDERWASALSVNAISLAWLVRAATPHMAPGSSVLFVTSRGSHRVFPGYASVGPAKALAEALVRYLAVELAPGGIRINALAPGAQDTASFREAFGERSGELLERAAASAPMGRPVAASDYVEVARFLTGPAAAMVSGVVMPVYGASDLIG